AADAEHRAGASADLRPRVQQDLEPLARLVPSGEDDSLLASGGICVRGDQHAVRNDLVLAWQPARGGLACTLGDGDPAIESICEETPRALSELHPAEVAVRVEGADHRRRAHR